MTNLYEINSRWNINLFLPEFFSGSSKFNTGHGSVNLYCEMVVFFQNDLILFFVFSFHKSNNVEPDERDLEEAHVDLNISPKCSGFLDGFSKKTSILYLHKNCISRFIYIIDLP